MMNMRRHNLDEVTLMEIADKSMLNFVEVNRWLFRKFVDWKAAKTIPEIVSPAGHMRNSVQNVLYQAAEYGMITYQKGKGYKLTTKGVEYLDGQKTND